MTEQDKIYYATIGFIVGALTAIVVFTIGIFLYGVK